MVHRHAVAGRPIQPGDGGGLEPSAEVPRHGGGEPRTDAGASFLEAHHDLAQGGLL